MSIHANGLRNGAGMAARVLRAVKGKIHFKLSFFDSCLAGAILLVLRSWPSTQPPLAACAEGSGVQFAQQSD